jgi:hypothetical protein
MSDLVSPEKSPPLLTSDALEKISIEMLDYGLEAVWDRALPDFYERQPILFPYVKTFGFVDAEGNPLVDDRPQRVFRTGAVIAERAYVESGYELPIHEMDTFNIAYWEAKLKGIPAAYLAKSFADPILKTLLSVMLETPNLRDGAFEYGGYGRFLAIGAGVTRHYLQFELASNS